MGGFILRSTHKSALQGCEWSAYGCSKSHVQRWLWWLSGCIGCRSYFFEVDPSASRYLAEMPAPVMAGYFNFVDLLIFFNWSDAMSYPEPGKPRKRSFLATIVAVAWSFVGLRSKRDFDEDAAGAMNPVYVIVAALIATGIFIAVLIFFVRQAVG